MAPDRCQRTRLCIHCPLHQFHLDLANHTVSLSGKKRTKYLSKVMKFQLLAWSKISCKDYQSIHGTLYHITFMYRHACSSLPPFSTFISKFPNDHACHHVPKSIHESLTWWVAILSNPSASQLLLPCHAIDPSIWVDASTSWGIGVIFGCRWAGCCLVKDWKGCGRDIGWAEAIALELAILWLIQEGLLDCDITFVVTI